MVFETGSKGEIKALDQELHVNLAKDKKPSPVTSVHTYGTGEKPNFIVEKEDGQVAFLRHEIQKDGSSLYVIDHEFNRNEAKSVRALVDPVEHDKAAQILLDRTKANAELSGIEVRTVASSAEESGAKKELEAEVKPTKECPLGSKVILAK